MMRRCAGAVKLSAVPTVAKIHATIVAEGAGTIASDEAQSEHRMWERTFVVDCAKGVWCLGHGPMIARSSGSVSLNVPGFCKISRWLLMPSPKAIESSYSSTC